VQALVEARTELERRREARQILTTDPELARQLCIGRPDLPRRYKDGGLVDANHAPATVLAALPGISAALADQVVTSRDIVGGFRDLSDMSITLGITPQTLDEAAAFLVFPRPVVTDPS
jgi:DNA uptake protein ComE-like DNA-binding protein